MADDNAGPLGGVGSEEPWALEETHKLILDQLKAHLKIANKDSKTFDSISKNISQMAKDESLKKTVKEELEDLQRLQRERAKVDKTSLEEQKRQTKQDASLHKDLTDKQARMALMGRNSVLGNIGNFDKAVGSTITNFQNFKGSLTGLSSFVAGIPGGAAFGALIGVVGNTVDAFRDMAQIGQTFGGDLFAIQVAARDAAMNLDEFTALIGKYNRLAARVGAQEIAATTSSVRDLTRQFGHFGLTVLQTNDMIASYTEQLEATGRRERLTAAQRNLATADYIRQTTELSKLTGKRAEEIDQERRKMAESVDKFTIAMSLSPEDRARFFEVMNVFETGISALPKELQGPLQNSMVLFEQTGNFAYTEFGALLSRMDETRGTVAKLTLAERNRDAKGMKEATDELFQTFAKASRGELPDFMNRLQKFAQFNQEEQAQILKEGLTNMRFYNKEEIDALSERLGISKTVAEMQLKNANRYDEGTLKILTFEEQMRSIYSEVVKTLFETFGQDLKGIGAAFGDLLKDLLEGVRSGKWKQDLQDFRDGVGEFVGKFKEWWPQLEPILDSIVSVMKWLYDNINIVMLGFGSLAVLKIGTVITSFVGALTGATGILGGLGKGVGGGFIGKAGMLLGRAGLAGLAGTATSVATDYATDLVGLDEGSIIDRMIERGLTGATVGAVGGSAIPILGTGVGAAVGGGLGVGSVLLEEAYNSLFGDEEPIAAPTPLQPTIRTPTTLAGGESGEGESSLKPEEHMVESQSKDSPVSILKEIQRTLENQTGLLMDLSQSNRDTAKHTKNSRASPGDDYRFAGGS